MKRLDMTMLGRFAVSVDGLERDAATSEHRRARRWSARGIASAAGLDAARDHVLDRAERLLARAREGAVGGPPGIWWAAVSEVRGELAGARRRHDQAAALLRRAVDRYADAGR